MANSPQQLLRYPKPQIYNDSVQVAVPANTFKVDSTGQGPIIIPGDRYLHLTNVMSRFAQAVEQTPPSTVAEFQMHRNEIQTYRSVLVEFESNAQSVQTDILLAPGDKLLFQWKNLDPAGGNVIVTLHGQYFQLA
jgi:hypothetical protein